MKWFIFNESNTMIDTIKIDNSDNEILEVKNEVVKKQYKYDNVLCVRGEYVVNEITSFTMNIKTV